MKAITTTATETAACGESLATIVGGGERSAASRGPRRGTARDRRHRWRCRRASGSGAHRFCPGSAFTPVYSRSFTPRVTSHARARARARSLSFSLRLEAAEDDQLLWVFRTSWCPSDGHVRPPSSISRRGILSVTSNTVQVRKTITTQHEDEVVPRCRFGSLTRIT